MSAILDFPPIEAPPLIEQPKPAAVAVVEPAAALVPVSIKAAVLAQFKEAETTVLALVEKYRAVVFNVSTTKGMAEAKAARLELREKGRFALTRAEKAVKDDVNDLKRVMAEEVERIVALVLPAEQAIDAQIKAEDDRKAALKAKEAERVAAHQAGIAKIRAYLDRCQEPGMTAARISKGIELLAAVTFGPEWQEFVKPAAAAQAETLVAMRALHVAAVEREAAAAQAEQERIEREAEQQRQADENARVAAELAEERRALDAKAAELAAQQKVIDDAKAASDQADLMERLEREREEEEQRMRAQAPAPVATAPAPVVVAPAPVIVPAAPVVAEAAPAVEIPPEVESDSIQPDTTTALAACREALRESLEMVQELVSDMPQSKDGGKLARSLLARVSSLRTRGGI